MNTRSLPDIAELRETSPIVAERAQCAQEQSRSLARRANSTATTLPDDLTGGFPQRPASAGSRRTLKKQ